MKNPALKLLLAGVFLLMAGVINSSLYAQGNARVSVILVEASNDGGGVDSSLRPYASTLQRMFRFNTYKQASRGSVRVTVPGEGGTALPGGQQLTLKALEGSGGRLVAEVNWTRGGKSLLRTRIQLRGNNPAVLGGPRSGSGATQLLILRLD